MRLDYFYNTEGENFRFYQIPALLLEEEEYRGISDTAKILYGVLLSRLALSRKNSWIEKDTGRLYITYNLNPLVEKLGRSDRTISKAMKQLYLDKVKGILSEMDFTDMSSTFLAEKKRLEEMAAGCRENLAEIEDRIRIGTNRAALVDRYLNTDHLTGTMTEALIDHIEIGRRNLETGQVPVSVFWNF